jgi:hypothetical protein
MTIKKNLIKDKKRRQRWKNILNDKNLPHFIQVQIGDMNSHAAIKFIVQNLNKKCHNKNLTF